MRTLVIAVDQTRPVPGDPDASFKEYAGRIRAIHEVRLDRPRDVFKVRFTEGFAQQHERLWDELKDDIIKGTSV
jgi:hypothetical protein